mmetsp:Transcript_8862/g.14376  ORF Transcript_8862/g.14376 Transcript_8862/m.14376 type:complete len:227 (+) Transcript_8862:265-945(+)
MIHVMHHCPTPVEPGSIAVDSFGDLAPCAESSFLISPESPFLMLVSSCNGKTLTSTKAFLLSAGCTLAMFERAGLTIPCDATAPFMLLLLLLLLLFMWLLLTRQSFEMAVPPPISLEWFWSKYDDFWPMGFPSDFISTELEPALNGTSNRFECLMSSRDLSAAASGSFPEPSPALGFSKLLCRIAWRRVGRISPPMVPVRFIPSSKGSPPIDSIMSLKTSFLSWPA